MLQVPGRARAFALLVAIVAVPAAVAIAQQGPVGAMFESDKARDASRAASFQLVDLPATRAAQSPLRVYLSAGDLERAFDRPEFRPAAAIVPTNTDLSITAPQPGTQRVLVSRVQKQPEVLRDLEDQIAARRKQPAATSGGEPGVLRIGVDTFVAQLPRGAATPANGQLPEGGVPDRHRLRERRGDRSPRALRPGPLAPRGGRVPDGTRCGGRAVDRPAADGRGQLGRHRRTTRCTKASAP